MKNKYTNLDEKELPKAPDYDENYINQRMKTAVRGKYKGKALKFLPPEARILESDLKDAFPTDESVNEALRWILEHQDLMISK